MSGRINDKVGPIVLSATVSNKGTTLSVLSLTLSESLNGAAGSDSIIQYRFWRAGVMNPTVMRAKFGRMAATTATTSISSRIRANFPSWAIASALLRELQRTSAARICENNPWVRIVGEQKVTTKSSELVELDPDTSTVTGPAVKTVLVDESTAKEASALSRLARGNSSTANG